MTFDAQIIIGALATLAIAEFGFIVYLVSLVFKQGNKFQDMVHIDHIKSFGHAAYPEIKKLADKFVAGTPTQIDNFIVKQAEDAAEQFLGITPTTTTTNSKPPAASQ